MEQPTTNELEVAYQEIEKSISLLTDTQNLLWEEKNYLHLRRLLSAKSKLILAQRNIVLHLQLTQKPDISRLLMTE